MRKNRMDKEIKLISITESENAIGDTITTPTKRTVFAREKSIRQSEFYQAAASGLKPELTFVVWNREYNGEPRLEFTDNGTTKEYNIIRTFKPNDEEIELTCEGIVNKATG